MSELVKRLEFFSEADKLKNIQRANWIRSDKRFETVAEHVWHTTLLALIFADAAPQGMNHDRVRDLLTVHDLVEVYAGDVPIWDQHDSAGIEARELAAGTRLTALLPEDVRERIDPLWHEFQDQHTPESQFARAIDSLHPMVVSWFPPAIGHRRAAEITPTAIIERKKPQIGAFPALWELAQWLVLQAVKQGFIVEDDTSIRIARELENYGS